MSTELKATTLRQFLLLALSLLTGCATNFEPLPLSANHPANAQAQEAPRRASTRLVGKDAITRKTIAQLERKDAATPDFQSGGMSHDMSSMSAMDHSKMPEMTMPAATTAESPASKEAAESEMKKTSDKMKKLSDEMKAKTDAEKAAVKPSAKPSQAAKSEAAYWTCVMHREIHADKPGQCPKCGMTLVKKEGGAK
ncbi:MAG: hypothetical protein H0X40_19100 [Chthoniobacterales bacterium]|nr:hypothetical protein [Chthoniobacterales bacterium]